MRLAFSLAVLLVAVYPAAGDEYSQLVRGTAWVRTTTQGVGAGWIVDAERRWLITNLHVVGDQDKVEAFFAVEKDGKPVAERQFYLENQKSLHVDGHAVWGKVIARRESSDLALVELDGLPKGIHALKLADALPSPGERVLSVGHRHDSEALWLACSGEIRQVGKLTDGYFWRSKKLAVNAPCLIAQSPILPGDSGGPLANEKGDVVGVVSGFRSSPQATIAIQVCEVRELLAQANKENPVNQPDPKKANNEVYRKLAAATVWVRPTATEGRAAGFVIDAERKLVLTTNSGAGNFDLVDVIFPKTEKNELVAETSAYADRLGLRLDGWLVRGIVLARDEQRDLAIIELESLPKGTGALMMSNEEPKPTEKVQAISHPSGVELLWLHSSGTVRQIAKLELVAKPLRGEWLKPRTLLLQIPHQAGSAGGPVLDEHGDVVGLLAAKEGTQQQLGYAVAASEIRTFLEAARPMYDPRGSEDYHRRGKLLFSRGKRTVGFKLIEQAHYLNLRDAAVLVDLFAAAASKGIAGYDLEVAEKLVALKPESLQYQAFLAQALASNGEREKALQLCQQMLTPDRKIGEVYFARSLCGKDEKPDLDKAILHDPTLTKAYVARALYFQSNGDTESAIADWTRAIELDPYEFAALNSRASLLVKKKELRRATRDYERLVEIRPELSSNHSQLASVWLELIDEAKAIPILMSALRLGEFRVSSTCATIANHGARIREQFPDDATKRLKWFEQSLAAIRDAASAEVSSWNDQAISERKKAIVMDIDGLLDKRQKEWDEKRWADELEQQVREWSKRK